jgi:Flp pilus assembly protein TadG
MAARVMARQEPDRGSVTAETAVATTGLVLVLGALLAVAAAALTQVRVADAAGAGARAAARGDSPRAIQEAAVRLGGQDSTATVRSGGDLVTVTVTTPVRLPLVGQPVLDVTASAVARVEVVGTGP